MGPLHVHRNGAGALIVVVYPSPDTEIEQPLTNGGGKIGPPVIGHAVASG